MKINVELLVNSVDGKPILIEHDANHTLEEWVKAGRPSYLKILKAVDDAIALVDISYGKYILIEMNDDGSYDIFEGVDIAVGNNYAIIGSYYGDESLYKIIE